MSGKAGQVYSYIAEYKLKFGGCPPTYDEIRAEFGWKSKNTAYYHVSRLEKAGLVLRDNQRHIRLPGEGYTLPAMMKGRLDVVAPANTLTA